MKHLYYIFALLMLVSCGTDNGKNDGAANAGENGTGILGGLPAIYGEGYERAKALQEEIQAAYRSGGSPDRSLAEEMAKLPKEVKAKAQEAGDITGNEIKIDGECPYDFVKIDRAVVNNVKFVNNGAMIYIGFVPAAGYDFSTVPVGSTLYYICLTEENSLIYMNALHFPSDGTTSISLSMLPSGKSSPAVWGQFAKIKFVSREDFYGMRNAVRR